MESVAKEKVETVAKAEEGTKKKSFGTKFMNFLSYGGFLVILIGGFALYLFFWWLFKKG
jgi:prepilin signal peptidase PulO-like enzyme (type II secretory pathway)